MYSFPSDEYQIDDSLIANPIHPDTECAMIMTTKGKCINCGDKRETHGYDFKVWTHFGHEQVASVFLLCVLCYRERPRLFGGLHIYKFGSEWTSEQMFRSGWRN